MKSILIVDDNLEILQLLSYVLKQHFQIYEATGVRKAAKFLETIAVDAICCDYNMQDGTGLELLERLREQGIRTPFMLMSASDERYLANQVQNLGGLFCCKTDRNFIEKIKAMV